MLVIWRLCFGWFAPISINWILMNWSSSIVFQSSSFASLSEIIGSSSWMRWSTLVTVLSKTCGLTVWKCIWRWQSRAIFWIIWLPCLSPWYSGSRRIAGDRVPYSRVLGDLGYLSKELKERLEAKGIHLWTPLRKNMEGIDEGNIPAILAIRGTIETWIFVLNAMFDIEHPIVRSLAGWQLEIEQVLLAYHLEFFIN